MKKIIQKIKCWLGEHDLEIFESKYVPGMLFGGWVKSNHWRCTKCGWIDPSWSVTETLEI